MLSREITGGAAGRQPRLLLLGCFTKSSWEPRVLRKLSADVDEIAGANCEPPSLQRVQMHPESRCTGTACSCHSPPPPPSCGREPVLQTFGQLLWVPGALLITVISSSISQLGFHSIQHQGAKKLMVPFPYSLTVGSLAARGKLQIHFKSTSNKRKKFLRGALRQLLSTGGFPEAGLPVKRLPAGLSPTPTSRNLGEEIGEVTCLRKWK